MLTENNNDVVANRVGLINGDVYLGGGADIYDGRGGETTGTVFGDSGADLFIGNVAEVDVFNGGSDVDTLDFRVQAPLAWHWTVPLPIPVLRRAIPTWPSRTSSVGHRQ